MASVKHLAKLSVRNEKHFRRIRQLELHLWKKFVRVVANDNKNILEQSDKWSYGIL